MALINGQIKAWLRKAEQAAVAFERKDKKNILIKASRPIVKNAKAIAPVSARPHYRYVSGGGRIKYNPGNLKRSIKRINLKKTQDVFVGPQFRKKKVMEYGGPGQPTDAYYASMVYGSAAKFNRRVLAPAVETARSGVTGKLKKEILKAYKRRAAQRGIKTS